MIRPLKKTLSMAAAALLATAGALAQELVFD
jgi:hypothetical protein